MPALLLGVLLDHDPGRHAVVGRSQGPLPLEVELVLGGTGLVVRRGDLELLRLEDFRVEGRADLDLARF